MTDTQDLPHQLAALLAWYREMGVTAALDPSPVDWRRRGDVAPGSQFVMPQGAQGSLAASSRVAPKNRELPGPSQAPAIGQTAIKPSTAARSHPASPPTSPTAAAPTARPSPPSQPPRASGAVRAFDAAGGAAVTGGAVKVVAQSLDELAIALRAFEGCGLKATAKSLCLFRGSERARVMVIGEAPSREDDIAGQPFVGPAGQFLDAMLAAISLANADLHITNLVYWRPPGNRAPTAQEVAACAPFLNRQIELVGPEFILLVGGASAKHILSTEDSIMKVRGKWRNLEIGGRPMKVLATLHPDYVLQAPASKRQVWRDLLMLQSVL